MNDRLRLSQGISAYRKTAVGRKIAAGLAGSLLIGGIAHAEDRAGELTTLEDSDKDAIVVVGERERINTLNSRLGDVQDAPQSISIIAKEVIEQQAASSLRDVLRNVSGISMAAGEGGGGPGGDNLTLRGFGARNDIFVDGIRDFASYTRDVFNIEQVEVVKGPASAQTGRGSTGGYINLFSKQPQPASFVSGTAAGGIPAYGRATVDINVGEEQLGIGGGTALRLNAMYHNADTPGRDFVDSERIGVAPSIAVGLGSSTRAILSYLYLRQNNQPDYGIPFVPATNTVLAEYADQPAPVDFDNYYGLLARDYEKTRTHLLTFALEHDLTDTIRVSNTTRYGYAVRDSIYSAPRFAGTGTTLINPQTQSRDTVDDVLFNQSNLFAEFATGGLRHDMIAGFEIADENSRNQLRTVTAGTPTDLFDPDPRRPWTGTIVDTPGGLVTATADTIAAYLFDTIHVSDQLLLTGGLRWERYKSTFAPAGAAAPFERVDKNVTWRAGLTYKPVPQLSLYAGAGTSVNPSIENMTQTNVSADLAALDPERSRTYEVGAKWDGFGGRLLLNAAIFRTDKVNARTDGLPGEPAIVLAGRQRVDGFELGATGKLTRHWSLIASYSHIDAKIVESNDPAEVGNNLRNVPDHSGTLWSVYKLPSGLEFGGGVRYVGERFTNEANTRRIGDYWLADATIAYEFSPRLTARLNVFNLFDKRYIDQVGGGHFVPGAGRSAIATVAFTL
ncbi:TonB-dependent receptor [Sphingosinicella rhizophila]|uniref:TonB-dependent siderophore receptor n=1 Tax=Sphingosinicella rhizophila TaxID=3050082 RepID=A0ABU3Q4P0_9SPHN|nr:TonB-dependent siderophore receptor [Sphingosinicella sp. GR2756]MDT9598385.1 TonB-dependent siderophore receptor [Sphingosinicella sp. GR2756]